MEPELYAYADPFAHHYWGVDEVYLAKCLGTNNREKLEQMLGLKPNQATWSTLQDFPPENWELRVQSGCLPNSELPPEKRTFLICHTDGPPEIIKEAVLRQKGLIRVIIPPEIGMKMKEFPNLRDLTGFVCLPKQQWDELI